MSNEIQIVFDDEVKYILGQPNFTVARIAWRLKELGLYEIDTKAEEEQAIVLHWELNLYLKHGKDWHEEAEKILK